ncbi:hypothetical protein B9Z55_016402 [Caenorhabditis nigoni]|uniref:7TM GPCR serpentine receptor class x (Srx) domain-containing protein n=1 Tax=Caenorhabditis nigoni TaxID=1611254 RepID=A0A2G5T5D5_9PELO|nr:hypothetical protein B9Z55_016402 [Caenorhabditis nigoni]
MVAFGMVPVLTQKIGAPLSLGINAILLQLVCHKSPKEIGMYKYLLCYISVFETAFAFLNVLIQPASFILPLRPSKSSFQDFFSHSTVFLVVVRTDRLNLPIWFIYIADALFCGMFGMSMALFALHFIYRYLVVTGDHFLSGKDLVIEEITYVGPNYYITDNGEECLNWRGIIGMIILDTMVTTSIIIIIIFATKCYRVVSALSQSFNHSKSYRDLQSQLLNSLVAQIIIPAILMQGPALYLFTFPIFHMGNEYLGELFCTAVAIYPVLDPLPTLFMIQHYRKALIDSVTPSKQRSAKKKLARIKSVSANIANVVN